MSTLQGPPRYLGCIAYLRGRTYRSTLRATIAGYPRLSPRARPVHRRAGSRSSRDRRGYRSASTDLIDIEYEELPAVFDPLEALASGAPVLHPEVNTYAGLPEPLANPSNAFVTNTWGKGAPDETFTHADLVVENTFTTPQVHQAYLEPHSCAVWTDEQDLVQIWASK